MISQDLDGGATEADGRASAPVGPRVATPLRISSDHEMDKSVTGVNLEL